MTQRPTLAAEYADRTPLQVRIATHERHSEHPDDPTGAVIEALQLTGAETVADIGCGDARFLAHLANHGHTGRLVGVDNAPAMVAAADAIVGVEGIEGDADDLPFGDATFDVVTARHMLYHVPDPIGALREFARVTKTGGRVVAVVNHSRTCARTRQLVLDHARRFGLEPAYGMTNQIDSDTLPPMMRDVFGDIAVRRYDNALVFATPEPLVRFAESLFSFCGIAPDDPDRAAILDEIEADVHAWFDDQRDRRWRDPKGYTVITATIDTDRVGQ